MKNWIARSLYLTAYSADIYILTVISNSVGAQSPPDCVKKHQWIGDAFTAALRKREQLEPLAACLNETGVFVTGTIWKEQ